MGLRAFGELRLSTAARMNIVFDIGGVVVEWQPGKIAARVFSDADKQRIATTEVFAHADWVSVDRGDLDHEQAIVRTARRTGLSEPDVTRLFNAVPPSLKPKAATLDLIAELAESEHHLFALSNMGRVAYRYLEREYDLWTRFEGAVVSCLVNRVKPEPEIFDCLLTRYALTAADTVFIDDTAENIVAAEALGIRAIHIQSTEQSREELARIVAW